MAAIKGQAVTLDTQAKMAFITGASSGLGAEYARQLAASGYNLVITARREAHLQRLGESLHSSYGIQVATVPADLSQASTINDLASLVRDNPTIEILVHSAGFGTVGRYYRVEADKELAMVNVHVVAPVMLIRAALPAMVARNHGAIIAVSSLAGLIPIRNPLYQSTKSFLVNFTEGLRKEVANHNVRVQVVCPGFVLSEFHDTPEYVRFSRQSVPRFLWMTPEEVVTYSLKTLPPGKWLCIPGVINQFAGILARNSLTAGLIKVAARSVLRVRKYSAASQ